MVYKRMLAIRVTKSAEALRSFYDRLDQASDKYIIYEHNERSDNIHIHGFIVNCMVSTDTLKNWIKKDVGTVKASEWSFKTATDYKFITYMSKGCLTPYKVHNFDMQEIEQYKSEWVPMSKPKGLTQYKLKIENPKEAKMRQNELMDMVRQRCKEKHVRDPRGVLEIIRDVVYREHKTIVGRYKIRDYYDYVMSDLNEEKWLDNMEKIISFKDL